MKVFIEGHPFGYEIENVARMFGPADAAEAGRPDLTDKEDFVWAWRSESCEGIKLGSCARLGGRTAERRELAPAGEGEKECELRLARLLWRCLSELTGKEPPWGVMTGIRPAKFAGGLLARNTPEEVERLLCERYLVAPDKASLCVETAAMSAQIAQANTPRSYSLYVSIPFCPTRCSYCSFVSKEVDRDRALVEPYLERLCEELLETARIAKALKLRLESVYIGGGTPTTLSAAQLDRLTDTINRCFPMDEAREFSVEAGRPDTITPEKLAVLQRAGVGRLSINPQTANQRVLDAIGRRHTAEDIERSFAEAREAGFDNINADLIAGLPLDDLPGFAHSLDWLLGLSPENITVHALTLKRASRMTERRDQASPDAAKMVSRAYQTLRRAGYAPYYMYKQKGTVDNLENTGYARPGFACLYNVYIMDELHTILACGAGGVTKLKNQSSGLITRIFNYKYAKEYLDGFDELLRRKDGIRTFYESCI